MPLIQIHNNNKINALEMSLANKLPHPPRNNTSHSPNPGKLMGSRFLPPSVPMKQGPLVKQEQVPGKPVPRCCSPELSPLDFSFRACHCYWPLNVLQNIGDRFFLPLSKWFHLLFINDIQRTREWWVVLWWLQQNSGLGLRYWGGNQCGSSSAPIPRSC